MGDNPLIAEDEGTGDGAGSSFASDAFNIKADIQNGAWVTMGVDMVTTGLDAFMSVENPFGALISNGVGWLLEHIPGLSDVWDKLTGDAAKIESVSKTWMNIGNSVSTTEGHYDTASSQIERWSGDAATSYRTVASGYSSALGGHAISAQALSAVVELVGGGVAACKSAVYDLISEFIEFTVIPAALSALATAWCTFGGSVAAAITYIEIQADVTAGQVTLKITEVTEKIVEVGEKGKKVIDKTAELTEKLETLEKNLDKGDSFVKKEGKVLAKETGTGTLDGSRVRTEPITSKDERTKNLTPAGTAAN